MPSTWKYLPADQDETEFLKVARDNYHDALNDDTDDRAEAEHDVRMVSGGEKQWEPAAIKDRKGDGKRPARPALSWNRLRGPIYQVVNDGRANKPSIKVTAMDGGDKDTAEYLQSRIRQIEYQTDADIAYDTCRQQAVTSGRGFIIVRTAFKDHRSFEQIIHIDEIENQFSVLWDPSAHEYDRSDADWWFIVSRISRESFKRKYGKDALDTFTAFWNDDVTHAGEWFRTDSLIPEVEYWVKTYRTDTLYLLNTGATILKSEVPKSEVPAVKAMIVKMRKVEVPRVVQYVIDGAQILAENPWIGSTIPIVPQWGDSMIVDGKRRTYSLIRDSKDPQKVINLTVSNIAELTGQIPKTKYAVAEGQIAGHENEWMPNSTYLYKQYKLYDASGRQLPPPIPDQTEPPIQALSMQLGQAIDATKSGTGIFDAAMGARSNETSGKAINARKVESDVATFHFHDNEARTRKSIGRILVEIIPKLDRGKKEVPVRTEDGKTQMVPLGQPYHDEHGNEKTVHLGQGAYDPAISTGASYTSQREQAFDAYSQIAKADQNFMMVAGDLLFRNMDAPGADLIADRYEQAVIPPALRPQKDGGKPLPPEAQRMVHEMQQQIEQMTMIGQALGEKVQQLEAELKNKQAEIQSREKIALEQEATKRTIALANLEVKTGIELLKQEIARMRQEQQQMASDREAMMRILAQAQQGNGQPQSATNPQPQMTQPPGMQQPDAPQPPAPAEPPGIPGNMTQQSGVPLQDEIRRRFE